MDLRLSDEQRQLVDAFSDLLQRYSDHQTVRDAETTGLDSSLWRRLQQTDVVTMAVPEAAGGVGATMSDLGLVAEQIGRVLAPAPVIEAQVTARLLAAVDTPPAATALREALSGNTLITHALRPISNARIPLVPAGAIADSVVALQDQKLLLVSGGARRVDNLAALPVADIALDGDDVVVVELLRGDRAVAIFHDAIDEWRVLTASALSGLAERALEIAVDYVKQRHAFGRPIGGFQAVGHRLAECATEIDGAQLLSREAAWSACGEPARTPQLASMALGFAAETAARITHFALHFHGGYGFTREYIIELYYRRARGWAGLLESPATSYRGVGQLAMTSREGHR